VSKKFKNKTCAYCGVEGASETADHVLAREFVDISLRHEIPVVPSCKTCNQIKSVLEHYATTVLPFGGRQPDSSNRLKEDVPKRLKGNLRLHREIENGMTRVWNQENGVYSRTLAIPLDGNRIQQLIDFTVRGLMFYHWGIALGRDCALEVLSLTPNDENCFNLIKQSRTQRREYGNIGNGALIYEGLQGMEEPRFSVWEVSMLGGAIMSAGNNVTMKKFGVTTGSKDMFARVAAWNRPSLIIRP
jgi:hypothetical protein